MARISGSNGARTAIAIRRAALRLIHRHGFAAMTLRDLAAEVGIRPGSLYNHIASKQDLLFDLIHDHLTTLIAEMDTALADAGAEPASRLRAFAAQHVLYHLERRQEVYIANFELRALDPANYARIVALRRSYEGRLIVVLEDGVAAGAFRVADTRVAAYAMLAMLTGVCTWYRPSGRLDRDALVALHAGLVLDGVRARQ